MSYILEIISWWGLMKFFKFYKLGLMLFWICRNVQGRRKEA